MDKQNARHSRPLPLRTNGKERPQALLTHGKGSLRDEGKLCHGRLTQPHAANCDGAKWRQHFRHSKPTSQQQPQVRIWDPELTWQVQLGSRAHPLPGHAPPVRNSALAPPLWRAESGSVAPGHRALSRADTGLKVGRAPPPPPSAPHLD